MEKRKIKSKKTDEKVDFPRMGIKEMSKITDDVIKKYAGIITYKTLSKIGGAGGKTKGGTFGSLIKSLKLYSFLERYGKQEMKATEKAKILSTTNNEDKKKQLLFKNHFMGVPIFKEIYEKYEGNIPSEISSLKEFLVSKGLHEKEAGRLANLYIRNSEFFGNASELEIESTQEDSEATSENDNQEIKTDENLILLLKLKYLFYPPSEESKERILKEVLGKFKNSEDVGVNSLIEGIKNTKNQEGRKALINALLLSFEKKYPILKTSDKEEEKKTEKKEVQEE